MRHTSMLLFNVILGFCMTKVLLITVYIGERVVTSVAWGIGESAVWHILAAYGRILQM